MSVKSPAINLTYEGKNISKTISEYLVSLVYTDKMEGESDDVQIILEDSKGLWRDPWFPVKGDRFSLQIGYDEVEFDCGTFIVDEIDYSFGTSDQITLKGLAASPKKSIRTEKSAAYENQTLRQIALKVAAANGLTLVDGTEQTTTTTVSIATEQGNLENAAFKIDLHIQTGSKALFTDAAEIIRVATASMKRKGFSSSAIRIENRLSQLEAQEAALPLGNLNNSALQPNPDVKTVYLTQALKTELTAFSNSLKATSKGSKTQQFTKTTSELDAISFKRVTQNRETDLGFLKRIAKEYGFIFSVRDTKLILVHQEDIEGLEGVLIIDRTEIRSGNIKDQSKNTYSSARVSYWDPNQKKNVTKTVTLTEVSPNTEAYTRNVKTDVLEIRTKCENEKQAEAKARAMLYKANSVQQHGTLELEGNTLLVSGNNFELTSMGQFSGTYHIEESSHNIDKQAGYSMTLGIKRVK